MASGFQSFCKGRFFSNEISCALALCWFFGVSLVQRPSRAGAGTQEERLSVSKLGDSTNSSHHPEEHPGSPGCTEEQEREARGNAASPQPKIEGRALPCFWLRNRRGISPPTSPYVGSTSMEGTRLQNHRGNKSAMRRSTLLKMPEGSSFG